MSILLPLLNAKEVWPTLSLVGKFYALALVGAALRTAYILARSMSTLRQLQKDAVSADTATVKRRLDELNGAIEDLRQLHILLFFLFGMVFASQVLGLIRTIMFSSMSLSAARADICAPVVGFAFFVFALLTLLHISQWRAASELRAFRRRGREESRL